MNRHTTKEKIYSDADLVNAVRDRHTLDDAVRYIYTNYASQVQTYILNNSGTHQDAQDVLQETVVSFIEAVRNNKFRGDAAVKTFLVAIARNIWLNELKKRARAGYREEVFEGSRETAEPDVSEVISDRELKKQFREVLGSLGENCFKILTLYYYENLSMKELLNHLPYENEQVVRNKKYKCLQRLTKIMKENSLIARLIRAKS